MNKTVLKEKESYETPEILDIKPVSVAVQGTDSPNTIDDPGDAAG